MVEQRYGTFAVVMVALLVGVVVGAGAVGVGDGVPEPGDTETPTAFDDDPDVATFDSADEFAQYFADRSRQRVFLTAGGAETDDMAVEGDSADAGGEPAATSRRSTTNVQERALDEPDVLKTGEDAVYYSGYRMRRGDDATHILDLDDPEDPAVVASIPAQGELLLAGDMLLVLGNERVWGYNVSDPAEPEQEWHQPLDASPQTARLHEGEVYLILAERPDLDDPCPLTPIGDDPIECTEIYRPGAQSDADAVYTTVRLNPDDGEIERGASVVGSSYRSATYVSENAIYLSYTRSTSTYETMTAYITGPGSEHLDEDTVDHIEWLADLDLSERAKSYELHTTLEEYFASLEDEERERVQQEFQEGLTTFVEERQRDLSRTGIVRIDLEGLDVTAEGEVPGHPLNQWSMDEHEDHLRIATTIPSMQGAESENDVYVLDSGLEITGSVQGLGETERIYSVRFEGDEGHVVTFRQIDPFYTLDLSDPTDPRLEGELKIPGVSHYLHPLDDDGELVLGVGEEDGKVKLSTFDVSDRTDPTELDVAILEDERMTEVNRNHRAFLQDERHEIVFIPGHERSYVFSYSDGQLEEEARVDIGGPGVRAMYIGDHLYVIGPDQVVVLDETTWEEQSRIDLP